MTETIPSFTAARAQQLIRDREPMPPVWTVEGSGSLYLRGCDLSGVTLPTTIGGWLDLSRCDLSGVTLPTTIGGWLDLSRCRLDRPTGWWSERGEATKRRCIAVSDYVLIEFDNGTFEAGCRKGLSYEQALAHWGSPRTDDRAKAFTAALQALQP